ncbi:hypothetical protein L204_102062 [Cryptococcus depauperatus]
MPAYVPPHLRNRSSLSSPPIPSDSATSTPTLPDSTSQNLRSLNGSRSYDYKTSQTGAQSQRSIQWPENVSHPGRSHFFRRPYSSPNDPGSTSSNHSSPGHGSSPSNGRGGKKWDDTPPKPRNNRMYDQNSPATLHVFGDSFVGPMKLMDGDSVQVKTFKGASAKGLNNPKSIKQVSKELLSILNSLMVPPSYAYQPRQGRSVLLVFGNVDLQINYIWQLANKPITTSTFKPTKVKTIEDISEYWPDSFDNSMSVLESATETSPTGPALGPELFVEAVVRAYTAWLEREIVQGPIGKRLMSLERKHTKGPRGRSARLPKVFIASALPPLIEDEMLPRIPEKYVERLEEEIEKQHKLVERENDDSQWRSRNRVDNLVDGLSTLEVNDVFHAQPKAGWDSSTSSSPTLSRETSTDAQTPTSLITPITEMSDVPLSDSFTTELSAGRAKNSITSLLSHSPPLCTLPIRIQMTNYYNSLISSFCDKFPYIFSFIDITPAMKAGSEAPSVHGEVDRAIWACPVDRTNVHPIWEPTLPLWLTALKKEGLDTDSFKMSEDAEETFKAYEADKRHRTVNQHFGSDSVIQPIQLRSE